MRLPDDALDRLSAAIEEPDLTQTRYTLDGPLGQGGMGTVYVATDSVLQRKVALKVLRVQDRHGELISRMEREARTAAQLEHPGIIPVHDLGTLPDGRVFYVTKLVQGLRLDEYAVRAESVSEKLRVFLKVCDAVAYAHSRNVLHRDLKPANIMVGEFGEVLVLDWGTARETGVETAHTSGHGTVGYMSPEQQQGGNLDARADIYSLGATLYALLARNDAGDGLARTGLRSLPNPLAAIIRKATAPERNKRYGQVTDLAADVLRYLDGEPVLAYRESPLEKLWRVLARHKFMVIILLTYMVIRLIFYLALRR